MIFMEQKDLQALNQRFTLFKKLVPGDKLWGDYYNRTLTQFLDGTRRINWLTGKVADVVRSLVNCFIKKSPRKTQKLRATRLLLWDLEADSTDLRRLPLLHSLRESVGI